MHIGKKNPRKAGFTLIELLVVVAIIAVIGAGVAVTYRNMDDKAKTAMEMSDIGTIQKAIAHWSFINDGRLPDGLDSLIDEEGNMYHQMPDTVDGTTLDNVTPMSTSGMGLSGPMGYTAMAQAAPEEVIDVLASSGLTRVYKHRFGTTMAPVSSANDSTFVGNMMGAGVDTSDTLCTLDSDATPYTKAQADYLTTNAEALRAEWDPDTGSAAQAGTQTVSDPDSGLNVTFTSLEQLNAAITSADAISNGDILARLCFIYPGGGASMSMGPTSVTMPMNLTDEIISNCGLTPEQVADPTKDYDSELQAGKEYYLVVMGLGRFASINDGRAVRLDNPAYGKRQDQEASVYSRYLAVIKVPMQATDSMTNTGDGASVACVLSPQGYSAAALRDNYISDESKLKD